MKPIRIIAVLLLSVLALAEYKPGTEVPLTDTEALKLAKLKQEEAKCDAQMQYLQLQADGIQSERNQAAAQQADIVTQVTARVKRDLSLDVTYDPNSGDSGRFVVKAAEVQK